MNLKKIINSIAEDYEEGSKWLIHLVFNFAIIYFMIYVLSNTDKILIQIVFAISLVVHLGMWLVWMLNETFKGVRNEPKKSTNTKRHRRT